MNPPATWTAPPPSTYCDCSMSSAPRDRPSSWSPTTPASPRSPTGSSPCATEPSPTTPTSPPSTTGPAPGPSTTGGTEMTGRLLLVYRLVIRVLRRNPTETVLLLFAVTAATATLTLGLTLN